MQSQIQICVPGNGENCPVLPGGTGEVDFQRIPSLESRFSPSALAQDLELPPWLQENLKPALQTLAEGEKPSTCGS